MSLSGNIADAITAIGGNLKALGGRVSALEGSGGSLPTTPQLTWGPSGKQPTIDASGLTADRAFALPDKAGQLALLGKMPTKYVNADYTVQASDVGSLIAVQFASTTPKWTIDASLFGDGDGFVLVAGDSGVTLVAASGTIFKQAFGLPYIKPHGVVFVRVLGSFAYLTGDLGGENVVVMASNITSLTVSYALTAPYAGARFTSSSLCAATLSFESVAPPPIGRSYFVEQGGTGSVTFQPDSGVIMNAPFGAATTKQWDRRLAVCTALNQWTVY